jgi:mRNA interferase RelE/StbE
MRARLEAMPDEPQTRTLAVVVRELARAARGIETRAEPAPEPLPEWLVTRLTQTVGVTPADVERMTLEQAVDAWTAWISSGHR